MALKHGARHLTSKAVSDGLARDAGARDSDGADGPDADWEREFAALQRFVAVRGTGRVPPRAVAAGVPLGAWVVEQRERYWGAQLLPEQVQRLEQTPEWTWSGPAEGKWRRALRALRRFAEREGTVAVPTAYVTGDIRLGEWLAAQRDGYTAGRMPVRNSALFEAIPGWRWEPFTERWEQGMAAAASYVALHGSIETSLDGGVDGFPLGSWLSACRAEHREGRLSADRVVALEALPGWRWSLNTERWERGLEALRAFTATHGVADPPQNWVQDDFPLGEWAHQRRKEFHSGSLRPDRVAVLEDLPGWAWDVREARWRVGYDHLRRYVEKHGHAHPTMSASLDGFAVGLWVRAQRRAHTLGHLGSDKAEDLEALPGWLWRVR
jgi:hypothetical protein